MAYRSDNWSPHMLIKVIISQLFRAEERRLDQFINKMSQKNKEVTAKLADGFWFQGTAFRSKGFPLGKPTLITLDYSLEPEMRIHLADRKIIEDDKSNISQILFKLYEAAGLCGNWNQDIRDGTPDCILDTLKAYPEIVSLSRINNPEYFLKHSRDWKQYEKTLPRIEFYSAARLLY